MGTSFEMRGVQRLFRDFQLGPLDLDLEEGRVLGLVGPNGAGKTTTIHMLAGLVRPSAGEISLLGQPMKLNDAGWKRDIGFVSDQPAYYERWSIAKNIRFVSKFYPEWDDDYAANLLKRLQLDPDKRAKDLSRGNRVKLSLLMALAHRPRLCLFDEPTSGLDPLVRLEVLDLLHELMEHGEHAILYSTHILSDLERIADEVAFLLDGQLAVRSRIDELADRWRKLSFVHDGEVQLAAGTLHQRSGRQHLVITSDYDATKQALDGQGVKVQQESTLSIEEIAVHILQGGVDAAAARD